MHKLFEEKVKVCNKCKEEKLLTAFPKKKEIKCGYNGICICCCKERLIVYRNNNRGLINSRQNEKRKNNIEESRAKARANRKKTIDRRNEMERKWWHKNKVRLIEKHKIYYQKNKKVLNKKNLESTKKRLKTNPIFKLKVNLRTRVYYAFKYVGKRKSETTEKLLGVPFELVKQHMERQFTKGMNWGNHGSGKGRWHIDHKIPLASAKSEEELITLCHYTNLQPLWQEENQQKSDKILPTQTMLTI